MSINFSYICACCQCPIEDPRDRKAIFNKKKPKGKRLRWYHYPDCYPFHKRT